MGQFARHHALLVTGLGIFTAAAICELAGPPAKPATPAATTTTASAPSEEVVKRLAAALVAWWPGDDHTCDLVADNDLEPDKAMAYADGPAGRCFSLDSCRAVARKPKELKIGGPLSVSLWCRTDQKAKYPLAGMLSSMSPYGDGYRLHYGVEDKTVTFHTGRVDDGSAGVTKAQCADMWDNKWHHVVGTYEEGKTCIYIDGQLCGTTRNKGIAYREDPVVIGCDAHHWHEGRYFKGEIDEVMIFNKALDAKHVLALRDLWLPRKMKLSEVEVAALLDDVRGGDAAKALMAMTRLSSAGKHEAAVRLAVSADASPDIEALIRDLDADRWAVRDAATRKLKAQGRKVVLPLRQAMKNASPEASQRITEILESLSTGRVSRAEARLMTLVQRMPTTAPATAPTSGPVSASR